MKQTTLEQAARLVGNDQIVTIGGTLSQRIPAAMVRELARQGVKGLHLVKASPGFDADVLAAGGCLASVRAGMVTLEQPFGMAPNFRKAAERGELEVIENACPAVMASLQAAAFGLPFQAVAGFAGSDVPIKVIVGENDPALSADVMRATYQNWYPKLELEIFGNAGHYAIDETPVALVSSAERFLKQY